MSPKLEIFLSGVTGYIGGAVLQKLLDDPKISEFNLTILIRSAEKAPGFKVLGITPVIGSLSDVDIIEKQSSQSDVVIAMADCDDMPSAEAILRGLKTRFQTTGKAPIFLNCSGTGELAVDTRGESAYDHVYDDLNPDQIETLADTQPHRNVDLKIVAADKEGYVKTFIVLPSTIYAIAQGKLFDLGLANKYSQQIPGIIKASIPRGQGGMRNKGANLWPHVHIDDISDLFIHVLDYSLTNPATGHGREGYYFGENGEYSYYDLAKEISKALVALGRGQSEEPKAFTQEELDKYFGGGIYVGTTSRCVGNRSRSVGWKPKYTTEDFFASIKPEVEAALAKSA